MVAFAFYLAGTDHYANTIFAEPDVVLPFCPAIGLGCCSVPH